MIRAMRYVALVAGAGIMAYPFVWMGGTALKTVAEALSPSLNPLPAEPQWGNFAGAMNAAPFARYFFNSFVVSIATAAGVVTSALLAGYAFGRLRFRGRNLLFGLVLATMMIPFEVTLIPNFMLIGRLGWYDTYWALIIPGCASAFSIFLVRQAFQQVPDAYFDAAAMDGCGHFRFLFWIGIPMVRPTLAVVALFAFLASYNALLWPLVVTGREEMRVVQVGLTVFSGEAGIRLNLLMAASAIVMLPSLALYFLAQRAFEEGSFITGIKS